MKHLLDGLRMSLRSTVDGDADTDNRAIISVTTSGAGTINQNTGCF